MHHIFVFYLKYNHLVCLVIEVGYYISFSFHFFKVKFHETLLSYVIYLFSFRCTCTINQKTLSAISSDENNVNKHTTLCDVRKLFKDRFKSTQCKVMFLTSNKIEYC